MRGVGDVQRHIGVRGCGAAGAQRRQEAWVAPEKGETKLPRSGAEGAGEDFPPTICDVGDVLGVHLVERGGSGARPLSQLALRS